MMVERSEESVLSVDCDRAAPGNWVTNVMSGQQTLPS